MSELIDAVTRNRILKRDAVYNYLVARDYLYGDVADTIGMMLADAGITSGRDMITKSDLALPIHDLTAQATAESGIAGRHLFLHDFQGRFHVFGENPELDRPHYDFSREQVRALFSEAYCEPVENLGVAEYRDCDVAGTRVTCGLGYVMIGSVYIGSVEVEGYWFVPVLGTHAIVAPPLELN